MPRNLREALGGRLSEDELKQLRAFDLIGDIAVVKLPEALLPKKHIIGQALMEVHRHVRTVLNQTSPVRGEFRTRELEVIAGEPRTTTLHRENRCILKVDLAKVYFSPRLATERLRIARQIKAGESVTNLFAGVGSYSIVAARLSQAKRIYSIDKNPAAFDLMVENIRANKLGDRIIPILGDSRDVVKEKLHHLADRVLMPLPELGREFLPVGIDALKPEGGVLHFYDFGNEPDVFGPSIEFARDVVTERDLKMDVLNRRKVRSYANKCYHVVLDLLIGVR
jgi:tRNA (guanine37-N1)-methyltransferase